MLDRAETMMHKYYGQYDFWAARRSMVFSKGKISIISEDIFLILNSEKMHLHYL